MSPYKNIEGPWFEVTSDVLYLNGHVFHRGDTISTIELAGKIAQMLTLGMIRLLAANRKVA